MSSKINTSLFEICHELFDYGIIENMEKLFIWLRTHLRSTNTSKCASCGEVNIRIGRKHDLHNKGRKIKIESTKGTLLITVKDYKKYPFSVLCSSQWVDV